VGEESKLWNDLHRSGVQFLNTDLDTAMTLVQMAARSKDDEKRQRTQSKARTAYDTVKKFAEKLNLLEPERSDIFRKLDEVKQALQDLGEKF
jgi:hypothetical protein